MLMWDFNHNPPTVDDQMGNKLQPYVCQCDWDDVCETPVMNLIARHTVTVAAAMKVTETAATAARVTAASAAVTETAAVTVTTLPSASCHPVTASLILLRKGSGVEVM